ncbi:hypothetical protein ACJMK2_002869, partial [Sinanodonta woodiana]
ESFTYTVKVGAIDVDKTIPDMYQNDLFKASRSHRHPSYNNNEDNDIGLLYISQRIPFSDYVRPICIATKTTAEEVFNAGGHAECYVSGWGNYHNLLNADAWVGHLQVVRVYLYPKDECDKIYTKLYGSPPQNITVCMDNQNFGSPTCH